MLRPYFDLDELNEIRQVLESGWVSQGPKVREFEGIVANYLGAKHAIAVTNCTCALHLSLMALGIGTGDEVLVADYTFPATAHAVLYCGAKPIFIDIDKRTYNINSEELEEKITEHTRAIIPVHTFGQPAAMDRIMEIAKIHDLKVIEDAACALGAKYNNEFAGTIGDLGCFSFHARKGITTGEGGMVVTDDPGYAEKVRHLSVFGMTSAWDRERSDHLIIPEFTDIGYNYKMSDISAAVGVAQMRRLDAVIKRKQELAKYWDEKLHELELIEPPYIAKGAKHIYQSYVSLVDKRINRNRLIERLSKNGIQAQIGTYSCHIQPVYQYKDKCPKSFDVYNRALALPMYFGLREEDIDKAFEALRRSLGEL
ncbi:MAG: DegT/DnrJ/EryC1/StrS family aminotransferase [Methanotrichaceae archaeon]